ncbi:MAG TPA: hypothetical protein VKU82_11980 [Planctomycetaceae bacterium]|nr:hypothetical protein [Planctomycetaceae bacterium]
MGKKSRFCLLLALILAGLGGQPAAAQREKRKPDRQPQEITAGKKKSPSTTITMEILTGSDGAGLKAREWSEILSKLDVTFTIRRGRPDEKLEVTEKTVGGKLRSIEVTGALDSKGRLVFRDQSFAPGDSGKLAEWLNELRTYGAQGDPDGKPVWGLTKQQFAVIHTAMQKPLASDPNGLDLAEALSRFDLPKDDPLRFSAEAATLLNEQKEPPKVGQSVKGVTQGTALAVVLSEQGLGFRPRRLPEGTIELTVYSLKETSDVWPVGWPRKQTIPETAPTLFEIKPIDLEDVPLDALLEAVSDKIKIPILIDHAAIKANKIDLAEVKISHPRKRTTWKTALDSFAYKAKAKVEVLIDEANKPFLWVTPVAAPARSQKE